MRLTVLMLFACPGAACALEPKDVFVVANKNSADSKDVAAHYLKVRKVPNGNLVELDLPAGEDISRADYDSKLLGPLRQALKDKKADVKVLLAVYGVPLRVGAQQPTESEAAELKKLRAEIDALRKEVADLEKADPKDDAKIKATRAKIEPLQNKSKLLSRAESTASVDSELMALWLDKYPLDRWIINPMNWQAPDAARKEGAGKFVMTCRLDGPTPAIAKRLVDDAVEVEKDGLKGKVYFDARGIKLDPKADPGGTGYGGYDESFREAAKLLKDGGLDVTLDDKQDLFKPGTCPDAALYAGWYSHANFIDCCKYTKGAVAWHLASSEATTLRNDKSKVWCPNLLKAGVAATIGPVAEPYTIGFPKPAEFFGFLGTGKYTLVETYAKTVYFASWMGVLVGDPLYTPFAKNPVVKEDDIKVSPAGTKVFR